MDLKRDDLLMKLGAARQQSPKAWRLVKIKVPKRDNGKLEFNLRKNKLREVRRREGRYLLRSNMTGRSEEELWQFYMQPKSRRPSNTSGSRIPCGSAFLPCAVREPLRFFRPAS
jgi:hypothetical protein